MSAQQRALAPGALVWSPKIEFSVVKSFLMVSAALGAYFLVDDFLQLAPVGAARQIEMNVGVGPR
jgi:hypothetical protein